MGDGRELSTLNRLTFALRPMAERAGPARTGATSGAPIANAATEASYDRLPPSQPLAYGAALGDELGAALQRDRNISEADLRSCLSEGVRLLHAVVVEVAATGHYLAYLRLSHRPEYSAVVMRRYEGPRVWSDFRTLRRALAGYGYGGPVSVYCEGHPRLACLGVSTTD